MIMRRLWFVAVLVSSIGLPPGVHAASTNADLVGLEMNRGFITAPIAFSPAFDSNTLNYAASVSNEVRIIAVRPTSADAAATNQVRVNSGEFKTVASGSYTGQFPILVGSNLVEV